MALGYFFRAVLDKLVLSSKILLVLAGTHMDIIKDATGKTRTSSLVRIMASFVIFIANDKTIGPSVAMSKI